MATRRYTLRKINPTGEERYAHTIYALVVAGRCPYDDYVGGLQEKQRQKIREYLVDRLASLGSDGFSSEQQFENYKGGIYGLKPKDHRLLMARIGGRRWVVVDAFSKADINKGNAQSKRIDAARGTLLAFVQEQQR